MTLALQIHVERFLQLDVSNEPDTVITQLLETASGLVEGFVGRPLELASYDEDYTSPAGAIVVLRNGPVDVSANPVAVTINSTSTVLVEGTDYIVKRRNGHIVRVTAAGVPRRWDVPAGRQAAIKVVYDAGFDFTADPLLHRHAEIARDVTVRSVGRVFQAAAARASVPVAALAIKSLSLAGSDSVTYRDSIASVADAAVQLTDADRASLRIVQRKVFV